MFLEKIYLFYDIYKMNIIIIASKEEINDDDDDDASSFTWLSLMIHGISG